MSNSQSAGDDHQESGASASMQFDQILNQAKEGDRSAISQLCRLSQKYLLLIANQNLGSVMLQKFGASDMVQQSMIVANQKIGDFNGGSKGEFLAWMRQILLNECRQATRGFKNTEKRNVGRELGLEATTSKYHQLQINDPFLTPSSDAANNEQMQLISEALNRLPELDRQVIVMRNWQELCFAEIGASINRSPDAARKVWSRAILKLESELQTLGGI